MDMLNILIILSILIIIAIISSVGYIVYINNSLKEGEEQGEEKQNSTLGAVMKHWNCDGTSNDIVLHLNLLLWLERAIVLPLI